jgi:hypothetical protein
MQCQWFDQPLTELSCQPPALALDCDGREETGDSILANRQPFYFQAKFAGDMAMYSDFQTVSEYLNSHQEWFVRCAQPMSVVPLGSNGYILTLGSFGALGYELEPKIALVLQPPQNGIYQMYSIPVPDYCPPGYEVDYQASLELVEITADAASSRPELSPLLSATPCSQVKWQLDLKVAVQFPKFIHKLPRSLIQKAGNRVLTQIVRQVSPRLTHKVQQDFHQRLGLPVPPKTSSRSLYDLPGNYC